MADIENALVLRLEASTAKLEKQLAKANKLVQGTTSGMDNRFRRAGRNVERSLSRATDGLNRHSRSQGQTRMAIQNTSYQIQDFAVQVAGGTSAMRAATQQLPQLLVGFGALGAGIGAVVAIAGALAPALLGMNEEAEKADDVTFDQSQKHLTKLAELAERYNELIVARGITQSRVSDDVIGSLEREMRAQRALAEVEAARAARSLEQQKQSLAAKEEELATIRREQMEKARMSLGVTAPGDTARDGGQFVYGPQARADAQAATELSLGWQEKLKETLAERRAEEEALTEEITEQNAQIVLQEEAQRRVMEALNGGTAAVQAGASAASDQRVEVERMADAITSAYQVYAATRAESEAAAASARDELATLRDQADMQALIAEHGENSLEVTRARVQAERDAYEEALASRDVSDELKVALMAAWDAAAGIAGTDMAGNISLAADEAFRLAANLDRAIAMAPITAAMRDEDAAMSQNVIPDASDRDRQRRALDNFNRLIKPKASRRPRSGGGGGGAAERKALKEQNDFVREAERVFDDTRTAAERYASELDRLNELHKLGYIDAETFNRAVAKLGDEFDTNGLEKVRQGIEDISASLADAIINGEDMGDALSGVLRRIAAEILSSQINQLLQGLVPSGQQASGLGAIVGGLFGGKPSFAGGGWTGSGARAGGLDGKGGFLAMMHPKETVIDHTKQSASGGLVVNVNNAPSTPTVTQQPDGRVDITFRKSVIKALTSSEGRKALAMANNRPTGR